MRLKRPLASLMTPSYKRPEERTESAFTSGARVHEGVSKVYMHVLLAGGVWLKKKFVVLWQRVGGGGLLLAMVVKMPPRRCEKQRKLFLRSGDRRAWQEGPSHA